MNDKDIKYRRNLLKGLLGLPFLGAFAYSFYDDWQRRKKALAAKKNAFKVQIDDTFPVDKYVDGEPIRLGIVGTGSRGIDLMKAAGFAEPEYLDELIKANKENHDDKRIQIYLNQESLNLRVTAICDIFDINANKAIRAGANIYRNGINGKMADPPKRYKTYKELIRSAEVDAVIIATPDHWHAPVVIEAAKAGKHVYCEKPLTWTVPETYVLERVVKNSGIIFQLGHQGRQAESYMKAQKIIEKNILGKINLIEVCTNRNSPNGAWVYPIHPNANRSTIDWEQFISNTKRIPFNLEHFFRWRCWWQYSTGLSGDLLTHEYDAINQIMKLGIPDSASSSGGIYFYKDGRNVPDVLTTTFEFPERDLTLLYSASLSSEKNRGKVLMGHDGYMELGNKLFVYADNNSTQYKKHIKNGLIDTHKPIYTYIPGMKENKKGINAITSATEQYFENRGLLRTYRNNKVVDTTHLHIREWVNCIRKNVQPSCDIDQSFEEAITAHMGTLAYKQNRTKFWDKTKRKII